MKRYYGAMLFISAMSHAQPQCNISHYFNEGRIATIVGTATGFLPGEVTITVNNGSRHYKTISDAAGNWALSVANPVGTSELQCSQEGTDLRSLPEPLE